MQKKWFEDPVISRKAEDTGKKIFKISQKLDSLACYRYAEKLRRAGLHIGTSIAEGSGSSSHDDLIRCLEDSRKSIFECMNTLVSLEKQGTLSYEEIKGVLGELEDLSQLIMNVIRSSTSNR